MIRVLLDVHGITIPEKIGDVSINVGTLISEDSNSEDLTLREACNKTIHSMSHEICLSYKDNHPLSNGRNGYEKSEESHFKKPIIKTKGKFRGKKWVAEINFLQFIDQAINIHKP